MLDRQWMREHEAKRDEDQRQHQERMQKMLLDAQASSEDRAQKRHEDQIGQQRGIHKYEMLVLGGAVIVAAVIGGMIQAGWFPHWFGLFD